MKCLQLIVLFLSFSLVGLASDTIRIPEDHATIQAAIDAADNGDVISVAPGTYYENIVIDNKLIELRGPSTDERAIIDGNQSDTVVTIINEPIFSEGSKTVIEGFVIMNGVGQFGGGIYCHHAGPVIRSNYILSNYALYGGGIACNAADPIITNNTIVFNWGQFTGGGALFHESSGSKMTNTIIWDNLSDANTGIYYYPDSPEVTYCDIQAGMGQVYPGEGNINQDPNLSGMFELEAVSPCIDAGDVNAPYISTVDCSGDPRILAETEQALNPVTELVPPAYVDMGADEFSPFSVGSGLRAGRWFEDNNLQQAGLVPHDFFSRIEPGELDQWLAARQEMDVFMLRKSVYKHQLQDSDKLAQYAEVFNKHQIKIAFDDGSAWSEYKNGGAMNFTPSVENLTDLIRHGWDVEYVALQSILSKKVKGIQVHEKELRIEYAVEYTKQIKEAFPQMKMGIIDALPVSKPFGLKNLQSEILPIYMDLKNALLAEGIDGVEHDFLILDMPMNKALEGSISFHDLKIIENYVNNDLSWDFGIFCTSSNAGSDVLLYRQDILEGLNLYLSDPYIGSPAFYVQSAWFTEPEFSIPDTISSDPLDGITMLRVFRDIDITLDNYGK